MPGAPPVAVDPPLPPLPPLPPPVPIDPPVAVVPPVPVPPVPVDPPDEVVPPVPGVPPVPVVTLATQLLPAQCWVAPQTVPQPPQFVLLVVGSTQLDPHSVKPVPSQLELQVPLLQTWPNGQLFEQLPQCVASDATQEPLQSNNPDWH